MVIESLINGVLIPAVVFAAAFFISLWLPYMVKVPLAAAAAPLAFIVSYIQLKDGPPWPPQGSDQSLFYFMFLAAVWPIVDRRLAGWSWWLARWPLILFLGYWLLKPIFTYAEPDSAFVIVSLTSVVAGAVYWWVMDHGLRSLRPSVWALILLIPTSALSLVLVLSGSALLSQLTGILCVVLGLLFLSALRWPLQQEAKLVTPFLWMGFFSLWVMARFFLETQWSILGLLGVSLILPFLWPKRWFVAKGGWKGYVFLLLLSLLPALAALGLSYQEWSAAASGSYY